MARGHQREESRKKAMAKGTKGASESAGNKGLTPQQRSERDALALAAKKAAKMEKVNSSAEAKAKFEKDEEKKKAKAAKDKEGRADKRNPLLAKQNRALQNMGK
eukprot:TRINITY_DN5739_c0_g1_i1.p1 TRINITY_DN5739_c0_g1~~TRINITY_DN5739_c0_g1_i1.p1  ORF type:complete len:104 (-),score=46.08 TRINITY_DN5739_c0_g1_i1:427-738(-)